QVLEAALVVNGPGHPRHGPVVPRHQDESTVTERKGLPNRKPASSRRRRTAHLPFTIAGMVEEELQHRLWVVAGEPLWFCHRFTGSAAMAGRRPGGGRTRDSTDRQKTLLRSAEDESLRNGLEDQPSPSLWLTFRNSRATWRLVRNDPSGGGPT